jgi:hypothetical protein
MLVCLYACTENLCMRYNYGSQHRLQRFDKPVPHGLTIDSLQPKNTMYTHKLCAEHNMALTKVALHLATVTMQHTAQPGMRGRLGQPEIPTTMFIHQLLRHKATSLLQLLLAFRKCF